MDITLKGYIEDVTIKEFKEDSKDLVRFKLVDRGEHSVMKGLRCYIMPAHSVTKEFKKLKFDKEYILEGCICCRSEDDVDFQVHRMYEEPECIWG